MLNAQLVCCSIDYQNLQQWFRRIVPRTMSDLLSAVPKGRSLLLLVQIYAVGILSPMGEGGGVGEGGTTQKGLSPEGKDRPNQGSSGIKPTGPCEGFKKGEGGGARNKGQCVISGEGGELRPSLGLRFMPMLNYHGLLRGSP